MKMVENVQIKLDEYLRTIDNVIKTALQSFYPSEATTNADFLNDIREITMNR